MNNSDLILVERGSTKYKETFGNRANIDSTDLILVERSSTKYKCTYSDWSAAVGGGGGGSHTGTHVWKNANTSVDIITSWTSTTADSTNGYSYFNEQMAVTGGSATQTGNLYIGLRIQGTVSYQHDFCLSHVQVVNSAGTAYRTDSTYTSGYDWNFHNTGNSNGVGAWTRASGLSTYTTDPSTLTYGTIGTAQNYVWLRQSNTSSGNTGAADGTYSPTTHSGGGGSFITSTLSQTSNTYFLFTETSGSGYTIGTSTLWLKSPEMTLHHNDRLRMSYLAVGGSNSISGLGVQGDDTLYFRFK